MSYLPYHRRHYRLFPCSIPTAYIVTRFKTGKDIRTLGGGNVGGLNTYKEVGPVQA